MQMWRTFQAHETVVTGDLIRFAGQPEQAYRVEKADQHYFQLMPLPGTSSAGPYSRPRIVRYYDVGYYFKLEIWKEH